jgi:hypothetical protein
MVTDSDAWFVRPAESGDLEGVLALHRRQDGRGHGPPSRLERETWREMTATPGLTVYLAEIGGQVVGTATALMMPNITYDCAANRVRRSGRG